MVFVFYVVLNLVILKYFIKFQKKNIHVLEILVYWLMATILFQNYTAFFSMNIKYFIIPDVFSLEMSHLLNRTILYPVITIIFLNRFLLLQSIKKKIVSFFEFCSPFHKPLPNSVSPVSHFSNCPDPRKSTRYSYAN
jgi:hypothetical protein